MKKSRLLLLFIPIILGIIAVTLVLSENRQSTPQNNDASESVTPEKVTIVTTLFPLYDIAKQLAADTGDVSLLLPPGVEPHSFEPTPKDITTIQNADVFIYTGNEMEPWVADIVATLPSSVIVVDASKNITLIEGEEHSHDHGGKDDHAHDKEEKNHEDHTLDPHFWLDFSNTITATNTISEALASLNTFDNTTLTTNTTNYIQQLQNLDARYSTTLGTCKNRTIVQAGHRTFGYLAKKYNLEYVTTEELSPNSEPSAQDIANLVKTIRAENAQAVFSEELIEPRIAETVSNETGVPILMLNGAHNITQAQFESNTSFITIMEDNLKNLRSGLSCD